jgi:predicted nucleic acid-binding protein
LLEDEVFARMSVHDMPAAERLAMLTASADDRTAGGRIDDSHIADVARASGAAVVVTDNRRHFIAALRHAIRAETPAEFVAALKRTRR